MPVQLQPVDPADLEPPLSSMTRPVRSVTIISDGPLTTGYGLYYVAQNSLDGKFWNHQTHAFEAFSGASWPAYVKPLYFRQRNLWGVFIGADVFPRGADLILRTYAIASPDGDGHEHPDNDKLVKSTPIHDFGLPKNAAGADPLTFVVLADGQPLADADAWMTRDAAGTQVLDRGRTNTEGAVRFLADKFAADGVTPITYYGFAQKTGFESIVAAPMTCD